MTTRAAFRIVLAAVILAAAPAHAQLANRSAEEWVKTLDTPARLAGLKNTDVVASLHLSQDAVVADVGAGTGVFEGALAAAVPRGRLYAVDIDQGLLDVIARKARELRVANITTVLGQFTDPKLPAQVDLAFIHDVLHHIENRPAYLKSLAGYLKPGGRVAVVEFRPEVSPHKAQPELVVSEEQAGAWMAAAGLKPVERVKLFDDKWFVIYGR